jgi:cob(I)alamin adenosyltransferase
MISLMTVSAGMREGYIQVYTGNGKGKTTAAIGLAMRAAGAGLKVFIAQFIKKRRCSEHHVFDRLSGSITFRQYGRGFILNRKPEKSDIKAARDGLEELRSVITSKEYDVVVLDEANVASHLHLITVKDLLSLMEMKPRGMELVITGRHADKRVIEKADLVTEMREIKHYGRKGVKARAGIEC